MPLSHHSLIRVLRVCALFPRVEVTHVQGGHIRDDQGSAGQNRREGDGGSGTNNEEMIALISIAMGYFCYFWLKVKGNKSHFLTDM